MRLPASLFLPRHLALALAASTVCVAQNAPDAEHGRVLFQQMCALCHAAGPGMNGGQGPSLVGLIDRKAGTAAGFSYSPALAGSGLVWHSAVLDRFLTNPTALVPGTNMVVRVEKPEDRRDLIAYLGTVHADNRAVASTPAFDPNASDPNDWRHQSPGMMHHVSVDQLPAPFATTAARNTPVGVPLPASATLTAPKGFKVERFADGLDGGRLIRVAPNGDIFIAETRANRVRVLRAGDGERAPTVNTLFAADFDRPFGIAFYPAGAEPQWIYVANNNSVVRFPYRNGDLHARGPAEVVVPKLCDWLHGHSTRDIAFSQDGKRLFISVGSASNLGDSQPKKSPEEIQQWESANGRGATWGIETRRANILVTSVDGRAPLTIFATGIRNPVGLAVNPTTGELWSSCNERDGLGDNLVPDYVTHVQDGGYYGWPWYYMGNHEEPRLKGLRPDLAGQAIVPDVLIQAHSAPLQIAFYTATSGSSLFPAEYHGDLFVALHGSWNRNSRTGYKIARVKFNHGKATGEYEDFVTGFVVDARSAWGRPVGIAVAHDGALLVTEDVNGTLWRISTVPTDKVAASR